MIQVLLKQPEPRGTKELLEGVQGCHRLKGVFYCLVHWEDGLYKTLVSHSLLCWDLSWQICGSTNKPEERKDSAEVAYPKIITTFSRFWVYPQQSSPCLGAEDKQFCSHSQLSKPKCLKSLLHGVLWLASPQEAWNNLPLSNRSLKVKNCFNTPLKN